MLRWFKLAGGPVLKGPLPGLTFSQNLYLPCHLFIMSHNSFNVLKQVLPQNMHNLQTESWKFNLASFFPFVWNLGHHVYISLHCMVLWQTFQCSKIIKIKIICLDFSLSKIPVLRWILFYFWKLKQDSSLLSFIQWRRKGNRIIFTL